MSDTGQEALAHAWEAGFNAASERASRALLLAHAIGTAAAVKQMESEGPVPNPYRLVTR